MYTHSQMVLIMIYTHTFVVPAYWIKFLHPVKLSITLSVADMNQSRPISAPTIKHNLLIFQLIGFLNCCLPCLFCPSQWHIKDNHPKNIQKCIVSLYDYLQEHNLLRHAWQCQYKIYFSPKKAETINETFTVGMLVVKKICHIFIAYFGIKRPIQL